MAIEIEKLIRQVKAKVDSLPPGDPRRLAGAAAEQALRAYCLNEGGYGHRLADIQEARKDAVKLAKSFLKEAE